MKLIIIVLCNIMERYMRKFILGLAIAKQLATQLNGDIIVESEYGKGSTFTLEILTK